MLCLKSQFICFFSQEMSKPDQIAGRRKSTLRVAALVHPRVLATSVSLPLEILKAASESSPSRPRLKVLTQLVAKKGAALELSEGFTLKTVSPKKLVLPDVLIIPAIWRNPRWVLHHEAWQVDVIKRCIDHGSWVACVGTGSFLLAASGALDHCAATTHWHWFDDFERNFPTVRLRRDQLITQSNHLFCVGSVNSVADLMVYLCTQLFSSATARTIENQFSPEIRRRFAPHGLGRDGDSHTDEKVMDAQLALGEKLAEPLDLNALATSLQISPRTLNRRFKEAAGVTPSTYLTQLRIEEARALLMDTNLSMAEIGWQVGYKDPSRFAQHFRRHAGVSPRRYRAAVRGKRFEVPSPL
jgi:transcriptional regulator GlxA family with amidase domain